MAFQFSVAKAWVQKILDGAVVDITAAGDLVVGGALAATGDLTAGGGFRCVVGPFTAPGEAGVTAADQTNLDCRYSHPAAGLAGGYVATRAGSIVGLSAQLSAAVTGEDQGLAVAVTVNGTEVACSVSFTATGEEASASTTVAKDEIAFAAGDVIGVSYTSDTITNTPVLLATVEIES